MIKVTINYIALVAHDDSKPGARVAFPQAKHKLEITSTKQGPLTPGGRITLQIRRGGGVITPDTGGLPMGSRVMSISAAEGGGIFRLKSTDDLLKGDAQAVLQVYGGAFKALNPRSTSKYKDKQWRRRKSHADRGRRRTAVRQSGLGQVRVRGR
jgi:hypothetical protein